MNYLITLSRIIYRSCLALLIAAGVTACIEDSVDTSPSSQPDFSLQSVDFGKVFTAQTSPAMRLMVYNRHDKVLNISRVSLRGSSPSFRLNVDGKSGVEFRDVEIRPNDSIFVFVNATLPLNGVPGVAKVEDLIDFETNGVVRSVPVTAMAQDVVKITAETVTTDTRLDPSYPYQVFDSLIVAENASLTIPAGCTLYFHDKSYLRVKGRLVTEGAPGLLVTFTGDRLGNVVGDIPFDLMASQWDGVRFDSSSRGNELSHTVINNTCAGVTLAPLAEVSFLNCRLANSAAYALESIGGSVRLVGCEIADAASGALYIDGGSVEANHCTLANYYLFSLPFRPVMTLRDTSLAVEASFTNCIFYGLGQDVDMSVSSASAVAFRKSLFKSNGSDDTMFDRCIWDSDPMFATVREEYIFDYRLLPGSPAIGAGDPQLTLPEAAADIYGTPRGVAPSIGAYQ